MRNILNFVVFTAAILFFSRLYIYFVPGWDFPAFVIQAIMISLSIALLGYKMAKKKYIKSQNRKIMNKVYNKADRSKEMKIRALQNFPVNYHSHVELQFTGTDEILFYFDRNLDNPLFLELNKQMNLMGYELESIGPLKSRYRAASFIMKYRKL